MIRNAALLPAFAAAAMLASCSSAPNPNLAAAQQAYSQAAQNPSVVANAPLELKRSQVALNSAQSAEQKGKSRKEVDEYAYLATRHAEIAQQTARLKAAQATVQNAAAARDEALLQARTQSAEEARRQASAAETQAEMAQQNAQRAQQRARRLQQQLAELRNDRARQGMVLTLGSDILFNTGQSQLKPGALGSIQQVAAYLKQHPDRKVTIDGYTDNVGSAAYNLRLSSLRADAVRAALVEDGVPGGRILTKGLGETAPVASNATVAGRQLNRRVQLAISGANGAIPATANGSSEPPGGAANGAATGAEQPSGR